MVDYSMIDYSMISYAMIDYAMNYGCVFVLGACIGCALECVCGSALACIGCVCVGVYCIELIFILYFELFCHDKLLRSVL